MAKRLKINFQHEAISSTAVPTRIPFLDTGGSERPHQSPNRYMHSPVEVVSLKDLSRFRNSWPVSPSR
ncbi:MAG: hypothetical protein CM1200mP29_06630 [Verrucomicrobiota bacterium]|nr:MAG: hypothetical protein CM1200mP29_06630 [Verrucomicrobiota bacterium]